MQIGTDTTWDICSSAGEALRATKTDGTLWTWGHNTYGELGINDRTMRSSPTQIPGNWSLDGVTASKPNGTFTFAKKRV